MPKWEYCRIIWMARETTAEDRQALAADRFEGTFVEGDEGLAIAMTGEVLFLRTAEERSITDIVETIADLGEDSWEMVSHTELSRPVQVEVFYFKRPIDEPEPSRTMVSHGGS